jgi:hypothetical protein
MIEDRRTAVIEHHGAAPTVRQPDAATTVYDTAGETSPRIVPEIYPAVVVDMTEYRLAVLKELHERWSAEAAKHDR